jgi:hypothetical protein
MRHVRATNSVIADGIKDAKSACSSDQEKRAITGSLVCWPYNGESDDIRDYRDSVARV